MQAQDIVAPVPVPADKIRRSRSAKSAVLTRTITAVEGLIGKGESKRLLKRYKGKLDAIFADIARLNAAFTETLEDDLQFEEASLWLLPIEEKYEKIICKIDDELEEREDEPASSVASAVSSAVASLAIESTPLAAHDLPLEAKPEESKSVDVISHVKPESLPFEKSSVDDWIDDGETKSALFIERDEAFSDALVGLQSKIEKFDGNPLRYHDFVTSFRFQIHERRSLSAAAKMTHLLCNLTGPAKLAIEGFPVDERGYQESLKTLKELFGNRVVVSRAYIDRVAKGPPISLKRPESLRSFYHELFACWSALDRMKYFDDINSSETLRAIVKRLPLPLQQRWKQRVVAIRAKDETPGLKQVVEFVRKQQLAENDAVWGQLSPPDDNKQMKPQKFGKVFAVASEKAKCIFCSDSHPSWKCDKLPEWSKRKEVVMKARACFNCLRTNHLIKDCSSERRCMTCHQKHHSLLHKPENPSPAVEGESANSENVSASSFAYSSSYLQVVPVEVLGPKGPVKTNALLDAGSQLTLLSSDLASRLGLKGKRSTVTMTTVTDRKNPTKASLVSCEIIGENQDKVKVPQAYAVKNLDLPCKRPTQRELDGMGHLKDIPLMPVKGKVELLLGANLAESLLPLEVRKGKPHEPIAVRTVFGWCLLGGTGDSSIDANVNFVSSMPSVPADRLDHQLERLWKTEDFATKYNYERPFSQQDREAEKVLAKAKLVDDHYQMGLLWKEDCTLPDNKRQARSRLDALKRRFGRDQAYAATYKEEVQKYIDEGYATKLKEEESLGKRTWYLPHHGVVNPNKPGRIRVVFDAAAKYSGVSLNDKLMSGPDLLNDLLGCILRFRQQPVALMSDIKAMFNQVYVDQEDRDALRFLWWENGDTDAEPTTYQMKTHVFGLISSPCCAITALHRTAEDNEEDFGEEMVTIVKKSFFMDDLLLSVQDKETAVAMTTKLVEMMKLGGFKLTKWVSNNEEVVQEIPKSERSPKMMDLDREGVLIERALGIKWSVTDDVFVFDVTDLEKSATKRGILSLVSSVFNPDGILSPLLLIPKLLLRDLWKLQLDWDDPLPEDELKRWLNWKSALSDVSAVKIPRYLGGQLPIAKWKKISLHIFCDASIVGIGAVAYLRFECDDAVHCTFLLGKSRCAPLKELTVPRLELQAAVLATRLLAKVRAELEIKIDDVTLWSDSKTTLAYIRNSSRRFHTFVANRVAEIRDETKPEDWRFCPGILNVADIASRGLEPTEFKETSRWIQGPPFLWQPEAEWPKEDNLTVQDSELELKKEELVVSATTAPLEVDPLDALIARSSSWYKLTRIVARCFVFASLCHNTGEKHDGQLTVQDLEKAEIALVRRVQQEVYEDEIKCLTNNKPLRKKSTLLPLCPKMNKHGVLRIRSRLKFSDLQDVGRNPLIMPPRHPATSAIIHDAHLKAAHGGTDMVIAEVRQRYWVPKLRTMVKMYASRCIDCKKMLAKRMEQQMAPLPATRVTMATPFESTGLDFFGPFTVKIKRSTEKRWCCLFTCFSTRAVHLEATSSLDTDRFIAVLRRFQARRGHPRRIYSDNGTNFVGAEKELRYAIADWNHEKIASYLLQDHVEWNFNPPSAPHMGGCWERIVRSVKRALKAVLRQQSVGQECFDTILCDVEAVLNARPLTPCSDDVKDLEPLTPFHFILMKSSPALPPGKFGPDDVLLRKHWRRAQALVDQFWRRWQREYLTTLHPRSKWTTPRPNVKEDDLVLLCEDNVTRGHWPMGRVMEMYPGPDGLVRTVKLKTKDTTLIRPVAKLCLLEGSSV